MELLRKLSTKTIMGKELPRPQIDEKIFIYRVWGAAKRYRIVETDKGTSIGLSGMFRARRFDGIEYNAGTVWMPLFISDPLAAAIGPDGNEVQFAYDVYIHGVSNDESITGYMYVFEPVIEVNKETDPLALMESGFTKALPAPKKKTGTKK